MEDDLSTARSLAGWCWAGVGAGGLLAVIGFASRPDYSPTFCGHDDGAECDAEAAAWEREYDAQETGASVAATIGVIGASAALLGAMVVPLTAKQKAQFIAEYYTTAEADRLIESCNAGLRAELSLSEADVQGIDLGGRAPVVPAVWIAVAPSGVVLSGRSRRRGHRHAHPCRRRYGRPPRREPGAMSAGASGHSADQSSAFNPATRLNSRVLFVTTVRPSARAWAAISRSMLPIGVPARSNSARTAP